MKKQILLISLLTFNLNLMASDLNASNQETNVSKILTIDLEEEKKPSKERDGTFDIIKGIIPLGHNDEVTFIGKKVLILKPIKLYVNNILKKTIKSTKEILSIKTSELSVGDVVTIKNKKGTTLVRKKVVK